MLKRVWGQVRNSLTLLHSLGLVFGDVHPGNILISANHQIVKLVDCESISVVGAPLSRVLIRTAFRPLADTASAEGDFESLRYCVAWALDVEQFRAVNLSRVSQCNAVQQLTQEKIQARLN